MCAGLRMPTLAVDRDLADHMAAFDHAMRLSESVGVNRAELLDRCAPYDAAVTQICQFIEDLMLTDHIGRMVFGPGEHELPMPRQGLVLERVPVETVFVVDGDNLPERSHHGIEERNIALAVGAERPVDSGRCDIADKGGRIASVIVDHAVGSQGLRPLLRCILGRHGDDIDLRQSFGELNDHGPDAPGGAYDQ